MASEGKDNSDIETAKTPRLRREDHSVDSVDADEQTSERQKPIDNAAAEARGDSLLEMDELGEESGSLESDILNALDSHETQSGKNDTEHKIDEQLIANLGSGKNDYGVLEELLPQIDFDTIPLTQPKRVMAKSNPDANGVLPEDEGNTDSPPSRALKRKKKPPSLLDSYFKGM